MDDTINNPNAPLDCEQWEALLADKLDGTLAPEAEAAFAEHNQNCQFCAGLLEQAREGQQWLKLLEGQAPSAPVHLLSKILARTQGAGHEQDFAIGTGGIAPGHAPGRWGIPFLPAHGAGFSAARGAHNARMLMTAAMAFFSVALTLSVAGVRLTSVHAAELRPQAVQANMTRSFWGARKQVVSFYDNLRLVYEVESKMHEMRRDSDPTPSNTTAPQPAPTNQPAPAGSTDGNGSGKKGSAAPGKLHGAASTQQSHPTQTTPDQVWRGWPVNADFVPPSRPTYLLPAAPARVPTSNPAFTPAGASLPVPVRRSPGVLVNHQRAFRDAMSKERNRI